MKKGFFITGTDTGVGKTITTIALMRYFKKLDHSVIGLKPVAAGCEWHEDSLKNEDALLIQENASVVLGYQMINPYAFEMPVSPHLAAGKNTVELKTIKKIFNEIENKVDVILVEGAGGWLAPLSKEDDIADLAIELQLPVILVVAIKLGCINHARLTFEAIKADKVKCAGWMAVCVNPDMSMQAENIFTIKTKISAPLLGVLPYCDPMDYDLLARKIEL